MRGWVWGLLLFMKQTLSDKIFNWFSSLKEWFQDVFSSDKNTEDESFYEKYWWIPCAISVLSLVVAVLNILCKIYIIKNL